MSAKQLFETLLARRRLFGAIVFGAVLVVLLASLVWPKTYVAEASVVIDSKSTDPVSGAATAPETLQSTIATQVDVISSHNVARKVVRDLKIDKLPEFRAKYLKATDGVGSIDDWLADDILKDVTVIPSRDSHVLNIDVGTQDPALSAAMANAFANAYIQTSLELRADPARRQSAWFGEQLANLRSALEAAQSRLSAYQRASSVLGTNEQMDIENARLAELSNQLIAAQATMYEAQNKLRQMDQASRAGAVQQTPDLAANLLIQNLKADLVRAQGQLAETAERFGVHHPQYLSAKAQVNALKQKLAVEIGTVAGSIRQAADVSARQSAQLQVALDRQRDRVLELKHERDHLDILKRDVDSAQQTYDAALLRSNQIHLESQLDQSNIAILNAAVAPIFPAKPKILLNVLLAFVMGVVVALATVLAIETTDRRIRSGDDVWELTGVLLLTEIPSLITAGAGRHPLLGGARRALLLKPTETAR